MRLLPIILASSALLSAACSAPTGGGTEAVPPVVAQASSQGTPAGPGDAAPADLGSEVELQPLLDEEPPASSYEPPERDGWQRPRHVIALIDIEPGMVVADVGAAGGYLEPYLVAAVGPAGRVIAIDIVEEYVRHLRELVSRKRWRNVEARLARSDDSLLAPESVNRIVLLNTWHHISGRVAYGRHLARALRVGGKVLVVDYTPETKRGHGKDGQPSAATVLDELHAAGLRAEIVSERLPDQFAVAGHRDR